MTDRAEPGDRPPTISVLTGASRPGQTVAGDILGTVAELRRRDDLERLLCWNAVELERLAMYAIDAKNRLARLGVTL